MAILSRLARTVRRWVRRLLERLLDRMLDGGSPPLRIAGGVVEFASAHPQATVEQWMRFATAHGHSQYLAGFSAGRRQEAPAPRHVPPMIDCRYPTQEELAMVVPLNAAEYVSSLPEKQQAYVLDTLGRMGGNFRVVVQKP